MPAALNEASDSPLSACSKCGCKDLYVRKDFPQKIGMTIVVAAAVTFVVLAASRKGFYIGVIVLASAAAADALLYLFVGRVTVCYRCRAEFKGVPLNPRHEGFDLATAEKYRG